MSPHTLDTISTILLTAVVFLLPIFFIPLAFVPFESSKWMLIAGGTLGALVLWSAARLKGNELAFPKDPLLLAALVLPIVALIAAIFGGSFIPSAVGEGYEAGTVLSLAVCTVGLMLAALLFSAKGRIVNLYLALIASFFLLFAFQGLRLIFGPGFLSFDMLSVPTSNLVGKWNDVAIFSGLITLLSAVSLDLLRPKAFLRALLYAALISSLILLIVVNFTLVWIVLAVILFLLLARSLLFQKLTSGTQEQGGDGAKEELCPRFSGSVLFSFLLAVLFIAAGGIFQNYISAQFSIYQIEARPSWQSTFSVLTDVYAQHALLGVGPNNFTKQWLAYKPDGINETPFWNQEFAFGVGIVPTFFITMGLLGGVVITGFLGLFLWRGLQALARLSGSVMNNYIVISSFLSAAYLWALSVWYVPSAALFFLAFLLTGACIAASHHAGLSARVVFTPSSNPRVGIGVVAVIFIFLAGGIVGIYVTGGKFISSVYATRAVRAVSESGDIAAAERAAARALLFGKSSRTYQIASEVNSARVAEIVSRNEGSEETISAFQSALSAAIGNAQQAIMLDRANYQNWLALGRVYEAIIPFQISGAYENAKTAYLTGVELNPKSPHTRLLLARTEARHSNFEAAREYIAEALQLKNNYTDAIFLLAQIEVREGNVADAILSVEAAALLAPDDPLTFFQLGLLRYSQNDYAGAEQAFERAVLINPFYSNARYFLGLSYHLLGRRQDALEQFERIQELNPDNEEVRSIVENLVAGRAPFESFTPPTDSIKDRDTLPIEE